MSTVRWADRLGLDRAVAFGGIGRAWQLATAPVTALLIVSFFTPETQGYYFTFGTLLSLALLFELGFTQALVQFAAHEWAFLERAPDGTIRGVPRALGRLTSIARFSTLWYFAAALLYFLCALGFGLWFFARADTDIRAIWAVYSFLSACDLCLMGWLSLLEGTGLVEQVFRYRMVRVMLMSLFLWVAMLLGAQLWALPASFAVALIWAGVFIFQQKPFLRALLSARPSAEHTVRWRDELLPVQWRFAVTWLGGYLTMQLFTPVLFRTEGPVVAGQMGMCLSLVVGLSSFAYLFIQTKMPGFGVLIARGELRELDRAMLKAGVLAVGVTMVGCIAFGLLVWFVNWMKLPISARVLDLPSLWPLLAATIVVSPTQPMSAYLRAHKREPLYGVSVVVGLSMAVAVIAGSSWWGARGATIGYLLVAALFWLPAVTVVFFWCRRNWHGAEIGKDAIVAAANQHQAVQTMDDA